MAELFHECGIAAIYHLPGRGLSKLVPRKSAGETSRLMSQMLLDIQNRGQLAAGFTTYNENRSQLINTHKDVGTVSEVFQLNHQEDYEALMEKYAGPAAIGHTRYATCGQDQKSYAQPFERHHIQKSKWFSFAFNGQLANYPQLRSEILSQQDFHLARETDTEILMHLISQELSSPEKPGLLHLLSNISQRLDGAYNIVFMDALGDMFVSRDPLGIRPLCYAIEDHGDGPLFAAASESVALTHLGFKEDEIKSLQPGEVIIIENGWLTVKQYAARPQRAHCFFEWIYFANVASTLDDQSVYLTRKHLGEELARLEDVEIDEDTIVVPVPDTAKAAADSMAFELKVPSQEGLIRNRYIGRTFIEGTNRASKVAMKYTPLREVLAGKKVLLVEDTIVRSTTMKALISQLKEQGQAKEIHIRVACPPIIAPCFYGIDMSTVDELFAPKFMDGTYLTDEVQQEMADVIGADSLRYLPIESIARCVGLEDESLCQACITGEYPTEAGRRLYQLSLENINNGINGRIFDDPALVTTRT